MIRRSYGSGIVQHSRPHVQVLSTLDELAALARPIVAGATSKSPVAIIVAEIDPDPTGGVETGPAAAALGGLVEHMSQRPSCGLSCSCGWSNGCAGRRS